ncbi:MAG: hypothetical protein WBB60_04565 [Nitrospira sp.]
MPTARCYKHDDLLVETPQANLSLGMRQLNGRYTQDYNRRHARVGHLLQERFKAILVEKDAHLLKFCRYLVLNPMHAKIVPHHDSASVWATSRPGAGVLSHGCGGGAG